MSFFGFALGVLQPIEFVAVLCLTVMLWLLLQWWAFEMMRLSTQEFLASFRRSIDGHVDSTMTLVTDREYEVELSFNPSLLHAGYRIAIQDSVADTLTVVGQTETVFKSGMVGGRSFWQKRGEVKDGIVRLRCLVRAPICGQFSYPGIKVEFSDDLGFFRCQQFVPLPQTLTVLPFLIRPQTTVSVLKHNNLQQHLGHHRHRSSGISSELHGIRDYQPGDPPRSIAWKATGRLGKVMTSQYENEVPIRSTIIVDLAAYQFASRPKASAGDRAISTTASIAKLLLADRDPVAASLLSDLSMHRIEHGMGERHLTKLMQVLLQSSNPGPPIDHLRFDDLLQVVFENASLRFPTLFDERYNQGKLPFSLFRIRTAEQDFYRRALAIVLEHLFRLPFGTTLQLQYDDQLMRKYCLRYASKYSVTSRGTSISLAPPYRDIGHWLNARNRQCLALCENLNRLRAKSKENELFVLIAPEPHDMFGCQMIENAIKTTLAAKHRVMFIAPEPARYAEDVGDDAAARIFDRYASDAYRTAESELGLRLSAIGASFTRIDDPQLMQLVAAEIGLLQNGVRGGRPRAASR